MNHHLTRNYLGVAALVVCGFALGANHHAESKSQPQEKAKVTEQKPSLRFINRAPAGYSHIVEARGGRTLYLSGQIALDREGKLVGANDFRAQIKQVFANLNARLTEAGAAFKDVVKLNFYITDASDLQALREA